jgi:predicted PurR-regulated permease PerM
VPRVADRRTQQQKSADQDLQKTAQASAAAAAAAAAPPVSHMGERALVILAVIACVFVMWAAQPVLVPTVVALVLALSLNPVVSWLEKFGLPTPAAAVLVVAAAVAGLIAGAIALAPGISDWVENAPQIAQTIERKTQALQESLQGFRDASNKFEEMANPAPAPGGAQQVTVVEPVAMSVLQSAPLILSQTLYVIALSLFLIMVREPYRRRIILLPKSRVNRLRVARILNETFSHVSHYLFVVACINFGLGAATAVVFTLLGVPYALVWGFVFAIANFIPYIGPTGTMILCGVVQLATANTLIEAAMAPLVMFVLNLIESNVVTPWLVSRRVAVSSIAIFLTVTFFLWLWGPFAAIVAVPLLILFSAVARHVPGLEPVAVLLLAEHEASNEVTETPRARFFAEQEENEKARKAAWWRVPRQRTVRSRQVPAVVTENDPPT